MKNFRVGGLTFTPLKGHVNIKFNAELLTTFIELEVSDENEYFTPMFNVKGDEMFEVFIKVKNRWISTIYGNELTTSNRFASVLKMYPNADCFIPDNNSSYNSFTLVNDAESRAVTINKEETQFLIRTWTPKKAKKKVIVYSEEYNTRSVFAGEQVDTVITEDKPESLTDCKLLIIKRVVNQNVENFFN